MKYIALTIGPIYKTLKNAKKPKELFASSYIFSYIMKNIIKEFKDRTFITPYIKDESIFDENSPVGLFHDRFIFESIDGDLSKLEMIIIDVCNDIASQLGLEHLQVKEYLQINYFEKELDDSKNPILELTPYLDTKELFFQISQDETFAKSLRRKKGDDDNFLTAGKNIIDDLKKLSHNNYYCVVHADGDNMSKAIEDKNKIENVSKNLFEYCKESNKLIKDFGGQTIYAGGDDLLFFAPVLNKDKNKTIFELCEKISNIFNTKIPSATLSFGISINYVKFPLYEAVENSRELLFAKAKNDQRNNIAFNVTKHSGQSFETIINKSNKEVYDNFLVFTSNIKGGEDMDNFLHSIHHKIDTYKTTINLIANNKEKLQNFFDNYFNESIHKEYKSFFESLIDFIYVVYQDKTIKNKLELIYATLRFVKFVQGDKK
ncbi:Cas10/Cmr2 second palm domain-containing protein [Aliarcobacter butzleri]|uniref:Cas10/Cmr2 second palm domain-containing protein n=1 Tax=Aliarcobacter butzleri TaxID=28197 RepID=UPI002B250C53|nr:type III-B CRISPR-associated protein Cas10/Cmr2 [Aliarcobacter butzleri]